MSSSRASSLAAAAALLLLGACAIPGAPARAYSLAKGESIELPCSPAASRATVAVQEGAVQVVFRGRGMRQAADIAAGTARGTCTDGRVELIEITATRRSVFTVQTR